MHPPHAQTVHLSCLTMEGTHTHTHTHVSPFSLSHRASLSLSALLVTHYTWRLSRTHRASLSLSALVVTHSTCSPCRSRKPPPPHFSCSVGNKLKPSENSKS